MYPGYTGGMRRGPLVLPDALATVLASRPVPAQNVSLSPLAAAVADRWRAAALPRPASRADIAQPAYAYPGAVVSIQQGDQVGAAQTALADMMADRTMMRAGQTWGQRVPWGGAASRPKRVQQPSAAKVPGVASPYGR